MSRKKAAPAKKGRVKQRVNLTLDRETLSRLHRLQERESLDSLSSAVRWLARTDAAHQTSLEPRGTTQSGRRPAKTTSDTPAD